VYPVEFYVMNRRLVEWMIYRLLLCGLLFTSAFGMLCAAVLSDEILSLVHRRRSSFLGHMLERLLSGRFTWSIAAIAVAVGIALVWPALTEYVATGHVTVHWSRPVVAVFLVQIALVAVVHSVLRRVVDLWKAQLLYSADATEPAKPPASSPGPHG
jgi:hypothetical protein